MAAAIQGVDITDVYSPERVAQVARGFGLVAGSSFDLTSGWDFAREDHGESAWKQIKKESPYLPVGSPPCMYFSMLQELNVSVHGHKPEWMAKFEAEKRKAVIHMERCCSFLSLSDCPWAALSP